MKTLDYSFPVGWSAYSEMVAIVNQGIDAHLQAVMSSQFTVDDDSRLNCKISREDFPVIFRRSWELVGDDSESEESFFTVACQFAVAQLEETTGSYVDEYEIDETDGGLVVTFQVWHGEPLIMTMGELFDLLVSD